MLGSLYTFFLFFQMSSNSSGERYGRVRANETNNNRKQRTGPGRGSGRDEDMRRTRTKEGIERPIAVQQRPTIAQQTGASYIKGLASHIDKPGEAEEGLVYDQVMSSINDG